MGVEWLLGRLRAFFLGAFRPVEPLCEATVRPDPIAQFSRWFEDARARAGILLPEAVCLATVGPDGYPEARVVLLKSFGPDGFVFYTNNQSRKGVALARLPRACLNFYWKELDRQVRLVGDAEPVSDAEADAYFASRPRGSRLSAWASRQSAPVADRAELERRVEEFGRKYPGEVPRPPHWSGWRVRPRELEFWQSRADRLHDRFLYRRLPDGGWEKPVRLCP